MRHSALTLDLRSGSADWHSLRGWQRLLLTTMIVCLPVPVLAASGMAIPLPPVVYRVAVGLAERTQAIAVHVPGFEAVVSETAETPRRGVIRLSAQERAASSANGATALEEFGDGAVSSDRPRRPVAAAGKASTTPRAARAGSAGLSAATQEPQVTAAVASAEGEVAVPAAVPPAQQSSDPQQEGSPPAPTPPAEVELRARPSDPSPPLEEPKSETPKSVVTPEPAPVLSDKADPNPKTETPSDRVDTPVRESPRVTPADQVDTPSFDPAPPVQVEIPKPVSLPEPPPVKSNGSVGVLEPPGESALPAARSSPRIPGRLE